MRLSAWFLKSVWCRDKQEAPESSDIVFRQLSGAKVRQQNDVLRKPYVNPTKVFCKKKFCMANQGLKNVKAIFDIFVVPPFYIRCILGCYLYQMIK